MPPFYWGHAARSLVWRNNWGFAGLFLDLISALPSMSVSFVAHGLEGLLTGLVMRWLPGRWAASWALQLGIIVMVCYFLPTRSCTIGRPGHWGYP